MPLSGKLELTIKITQFPAEVTDANGGKEFKVDCDGKEVSMTLKPKMFAKLEEAKAKYPQWVAAIVGQLGELTPKGFVLKEPNVQVFEKKPKGTPP